MNSLSCAYVAAPLDPVDETSRVPFGIDQLTCHLVVRLVLPQGSVEPSSDLLASTGDETCARIVVAQQVVPEGQPVIGIGDVVG